MDIGMNTEFKLKITPKDEKVVYSQSPPMPIHLKEDLIVDLALMHYAQIRDHHSVTVLKIRKPHICTGETQRKITSPCGSQEYQHTDSG